MQAIVMVQSFMKINGTFGDIGIFSLSKEGFPVGDGGIISINKKQIYDDILADVALIWSR